MLLRKVQRPVEEEVEKQDPGQGIPYRVPDSWVETE